MKTRKKAKKRKARVVAVDLDGVLCEGECWSEEECLNAIPIAENVESVNNAYKKHFIIILTSRIDELMPATLTWLRKNNIRYHAISNRKMPADCYCDDKSVSLDEI